MDKKIKLIIADDEPYICEMMVRLIDMEHLNIELAGCFHDGVTLEEQILVQKPDIVLTDISMPRQDGLEVIKKTRESDIDCRFIIISGYKQFEYAYNALKYEVDDYILKPVEGKELNAILEKICTELRCESGYSSSEKLLLQSSLIEHGLGSELSLTAVSVEEINRSYHTEFAPGRFRVASLKLDSLRNADCSDEDVSSVITKLRNTGMECLQTCCIEAIYSEQKSRVVFLFNYDSEREPDVRQCLSEMFAKAGRVSELFDGFSLTLCVGREVKEIGELEKARSSCKRAEWLRMSCGTDRILYEETVEDLPVGGFTEHLSNIRAGLEKAFVSMDKEALETHLTQLFMLPSPILCGSQILDFVDGTVNLLCRQWGTIVKDVSKIKETQNEINSVLEQQRSFPDYRNALLSAMGRVLEQMEKAAGEKAARPVMQACAYLESHYGENITLETMSDLVYLNPVYFSNLFKKETGKNFTDYITELRMKKARELLRESNWNINEIAEMLGYSNGRYFSKVFKKEVGVKPTEYRKIYG